MEDRKQIESLIEKAKNDGCTLEIVYESRSSGLATRQISKVTDDYEYGYGYISAYCHKHCETRSFKISRIRSACIVRSSPTQSSKNIPSNTKNDLNARPSGSIMQKIIFPLYGEIY